MNMAYHWKTKTTPILCIAIGIVLDGVRDLADRRHETLGGRPISSRSSSDGVSSLVRAIAVSTVTRMHTVPIMKQVYIQ